MVISTLVILCFDKDGFLKITDRKKEMFKTSGGKYIAPQLIENTMKQSRFSGDNR
jgi:long-chain acyl-CoA synthetase